MNTLGTQGYIVRPRAPKEVLEALEALEVVDNVPFTWFPKPVRTLIQETVGQLRLSETPGPDGFEPSPQGTSCDPNLYGYAVKRDSKGDHWPQVAIVYFPEATTLVTYETTCSCFGPRRERRVAMGAGDVVVLEDVWHRVKGDRSVAIFVL